MKIIRFLPALLVALACTACDMSVTNPGPVEDGELNTASAMPAMVNGASGDLSLALGDFLVGNTVMSDELTHSGNYASPNDYAVGNITPADVDADYQNLQQARWTAEDALRRMQSVLGTAFETNVNTPRAYLYAGFANRLLGENRCQAVIDGGPAMSDSVYFQRAESLFTRAYVTAGEQHNDTLATAALAGRASIELDLGQWTQAVADAAQVPPSFVFYALFSTNTARENNDLAYETHTRREDSAWNTQWTFGDPRTPWDTIYTSSHKIRTGQDGHTAVFQQEKYVGLGDYIPLAKGTEMLMIQAENALRNGDLAGMTSFINQQRAVYKMTPVTQPATATAAWTLLQHERGAVLWLEGRRLWDLRRWYAAGSNTFLANRNTCMPFGTSELGSNPNLH